MQASATRVGHLLTVLQIVVIDKLDYCSSMRNLECVEHLQNVKVLPGLQPVSSLPALAALTRSASL